MVKLIDTYTHRAKGPAGSKSSNNDAVTASVRGLWVTKAQCEDLRHARQVLRRGMLQEGRRVDVGGAYSVLFVFNSKLLTSARMHVSLCSPSS